MSEIYATRMWRTQVHVLLVSDAHDLMLLEIPGMDPSVLPRCVALRWKISDVGEEAQSCLEDDYRTHARVNLGAERPEDIVIEDWEVPS